jgi:hypothetical protein
VKRLSREAFERAKHFLNTEARPLERALFEHHFEGGAVTGALTELAAFQNADGGFGRALEPDLRTPTSSALATGIALRLLLELGCDDDHLLVQQAIHWLLNEYNPETQVWRAVPRDANDFPHAPWWHDEAGSLARTFDGFRVIPRAELVALCQQVPSLVPGRWLGDITEHTVAGIETIEPFGSGGGDDLVYALRLAGAPGLSGPLRKRLLAHLRQVVPAVVSRDPAEWGSYCITPLKVAPTPRSPVADLIEAAVQAHLDYLIDHQTAGGAWDPVWTWGGAYPEAWARARREWQGELTLNALTSLRAYGRLAG